MLGNFIYANATKLYFGDESLQYLNQELPKYGKTVQLIYGGGSIKKNGIYDQVVSILKANGKTIVEDGGVMPNPTVEKLREGVEIARQNKVDLLLAVGGGSCCDYAKAVSVSVHCDEDPWDKYFLYRYYNSYLGWDGRLLSFNNIALSILDGKICIVGLDDAYHINV